MVPFLSTRVVVAFDARSVAAAALRRGLRGLHVHALSSAGLPDGALVPSAFEPNLVRSDVVQRALREALAALGPTPSAVTLVLPHGVARTAVLDLPRGAEPAEYSRFRLGAGLPYPRAEAVVDFVPLGGGRILAAAVRRGVVAEYEEAAAAAGIGRGRVDLAPLASAAGVLRCAAGWPAPGVALVLGDAAVALAVFDRGRVVAFRTRRRDPARGEAERLRAEALRTAAGAGLSGEPELLVTGPGARGVLDHLAAAGRRAHLAALLPEAGPLPEAATLPWLAAALP